MKKKHQTKDFIFGVQDEPNPIAPYQFAYAVNDDYNSNSRKEVSDGKSVSGSYHVDLPDGRRQIVNYRVDDVSGFVADVTFEGEAKYPEDEPGYVEPKEFKPAFVAFDKSYKTPAKQAYKQAVYDEPAFETVPVYKPKAAYSAPQY